MSVTRLLVPLIAIISGCAANGDVPEPDYCGIHDLSRVTHSCLAVGRSAFIPAPPLFGSKLRAMRVNPFVDLFAFLTGPIYSEPFFMVILYWIVALASLAVAVVVALKLPGQRDA